MVEAACSRAAAAAEAVLPGNCSPLLPGRASGAGSSHAVLSDCSSVSWGSFVCLVSPYTGLGTRQSSPPMLPQQSSTTAHRKPGVRHHTFCHILDSVPLAKGALHPSPALLPCTPPSSHPGLKMFMPPCSSLRMACS